VSAERVDPEQAPSATADEVPPIRILAIAGTGQNGATLVSRMLGELPGFVAIGEVGRLWDKGLVEHVECSCGSSFEACPFWSEVGRVSYGGWDSLDADDIVRLRDSLVLKESRFQHPFALPFLLMPGLWPQYRDRLVSYRGLMSTLYRGIHEVTAGRVIVDAMKIPAHVYMLSGLSSDFEVRFVHLVRDSRGVANSNAKVVPRQGSIADRPYRGRRGPAKSAIKWTWFNLSSEVLALARRVPMMRVRYESFVRDPAAELDRMASFMDEPIVDGDLAFLHDHEATLSSGHLVAGNRMRLRSGPIVISEDDAWRRDLSTRSRRVVTGLTWPMLRHYGHLPSNTSRILRPRRGRAPRPGL
jgi:hypothetical protein